MADIGWLPVLGIRLEDDEVRRDIGAGKGPMYVASTGNPDRLGDVVFPRWDLGDFQRTGAPALYNHDKDKLVGSWPRIGVVSERLVGEFKPLATENEWSWVGAAAVAGELRSTSVGFMPGGIEVRTELPKGDPLRQEGERWSSGLVFGRKGSPNALLELSLVSVPANPDATALSWHDAARDRRPFRTIRRDLVEEGLRQMRERGELGARRLTLYTPEEVAELSRPASSDPLPWLDGGLPWLR